MPSANFMVPVYYLRQIADHVRDAGGDVTRWLEQNQLRASQLADAQLMLPFASFRRLVLDAQALSGDPAIGLRVGARLGVNAHGILSFCRHLQQHLAPDAGNCSNAISPCARHW